MVGREIHNEVGITAGIWKSPCPWKVYFTYLGSVARASIEGREEDMVVDDKNLV